MWIGNESSYQKLNFGSVKKEEISLSGSNWHDIEYTLPKDVNPAFVHIVLSAKGQKYNRNYYNVVIGEESTTICGTEDSANMGQNSVLSCNSYFPIPLGLDKLVVKFVAGGGTGNKNTLTGYIEVAAWY